MDGPGPEGSRCGASKLSCYISSMPTTVDQLKSICESLEIKLKPNPEQERTFYAWFETGNYVNGKGEKLLFVVFKLSENGHYLEVFAPEVYNLKGSRSKGHALAVLAEMAFRTRSLQCEFDNNDGEVRYSVDHWIMDTQLSAKQVDRLVEVLLRCADAYHPVIVKAKDEGKIDFDCEWQPPAAPATPEAVTPELADLLRRAGGAEGLARLLAEKQA